MGGSGHAAAAHVPHWLGSVGTAVGVQQRLMRHADVRTTMNTYGTVFTPDMTEAHNKIVDIAFIGTGTAQDRYLSC